MGGFKRDRGNSLLSRPWLLALLLLGASVRYAEAGPLPAWTKSTPMHLLIAYGTGIPSGDVLTRVSRAGGHLVRAHEQLGIAVVDGSTETLARLQHDPRIAFVAADRVVSTHVLSTSHSFPLREVLASPAADTLRPHASAPKAVQPPPSDRYYSQTPQGWAVRNVGGYGGLLADSSAAGPWNVSAGRGVRIAVLDSGVDQNHPDLAPNLVFNTSEIDQAVLPSACDDGSPQDQQGHGTWAASLAAGAAGQSTGDVVGAAPKAALLNIKVMQRMEGAGSTLEERCTNGQSSGMISWVIQGIDDAVAQHADVISLSLGTLVDLTSSDGRALRALFNRATEAAAASGAVIIASAGNDGLDLSNPNLIELPAQANGVLPVVASTNPACAEDLTPEDACAPGPVTIPYYSNYGSTLAGVAAPGGSYPRGGDDANSGWVRGACSMGLDTTEDGLPEDGKHSFGCFNLGHQQYVQAIGTSASAPLVAGVVALIRAAHPGWDPATVVAALMRTARPIAGTRFGVADAAAALSYVP